MIIEFLLIFPLLMDRNPARESLLTKEKKDNIDLSYPEWFFTVIFQG